MQLSQGRRPSPGEITDIFRADWAAAQLDDLYFKDGEDPPGLSY
jgi:hypothetical protein